MASNQENPLYLIESPSKAEQVAQTIRTQVANGELRHGQALASTRQLAADFHVSVGTITGAIQILEGEGLVISRPRSGRAIHAPEQDAALGRELASSTGDDDSAADDESLASEVRALREMVEGLQAQVAGLSGRKAPLDDPGPENSVTTTCKVVTGLQSAPPAIARELGLPRGATVVRKHEILYRDGIPVCATTAWIDGRRFAKQDRPGFEETDRYLHGPIGYADVLTGRPTARITYKDSAGSASSQDAATLGVPAGSAIIVGRSWRQDGSGDITEYTESVSASGVLVSRRKDFP